MRIFVKLRSLLAAHKGLAKKLMDLEKKYDGQFKSVFDAIELRRRTAARPLFINPQL